MPLFDSFLVLVIATSLWLVALVLTTVFHELAHALTAVSIGGTPTLHHNWVATGDHGKWATVAVTAAGPFASLVQGVVFWIVFTLLPANLPVGPARLLALTLACLGLSTAFGYLLITPFPNAGDMSKIAGLLNLNLGYQIALSVLGAVFLTFLARYAGVEYHRMTPFSVSSYRLDLVVFAAIPWLAAAAILIVLNGTGQDTVLRIFPFFAGFYIAIAIADGAPETPIAQVPMLWTRPMALVFLVMLAIILAGYIRLKSGVVLGSPMSRG